MRARRKTGLLFIGWAALIMTLALALAWARSFFVPSEFRIYNDGNDGYGSFVAILTTPRGIEVEWRSPIDPYFPEHAEFTDFSVTIPYAPLLFILGLTSFWVLIHGGSSGRRSDDTTRDPKV